jgi:hypothetical protein
MAMEFSIKVENDATRLVFAQPPRGDTHRGSAGLSVEGTLDMMTDINMTVVMLGATTTFGYGQMLLTMLVLCVMLQLLVAFIQNRKAPGWVLAREMIYVLCCVKGGVDAHRVAKGREQEISIFSDLACDRETELGTFILLLPRHAIPSYL